MDDGEACFICGLGVEGLHKSCADLDWAARGAEEPDGCVVCGSTRNVSDYDGICAVCDKMADRDTITGPNWG